MFSADRSYFASPTAIEEHLKGLVAAMASTHPPPRRRAREAVAAARRRCMWRSLLACVNCNVEDAPALN